MGFSLPQFSFFLISFLVWRLSSHLNLFLIFDFSASLISFTSFPSVLSSRTWSTRWTQPPWSPRPASPSGRAQQSRAPACCWWSAARTGSCVGGGGDRQVATESGQEKKETQILYILRRVGNRQGKTESGQWKRKEMQIIFFFRRMGKQGGK